MESAQLATLYRTQRLIRMGEWLERNKHTITLAFESLDAAHDLLMDPEGPLDELVEHVSFKQLAALQALMVLVRELNVGDDFEAVMGQDVTLRQLGVSDQVVIKAPKPFEATAQQIKDLPTTEENHD